MKTKIKCLSKPALVVGLYVAILHALWTVLVALGVGQTVIDWIFPLHFINSLYTISDFNLFTAASLTIMAFVGGYLATLLFIGLWKLVKKK